MSRVKVSTILGEIELRNRRRDKTLSLKFSVFIVNSWKGPVRSSSESSSSSFLSRSLGLGKLRF